MRIMLADDHPILQEGLVQLLSREFPDAEYTKTSSSSETLDCLVHQRHDILILDIFMPGRSGLEVLQDARRLYPDLPILILSSAPEDQLAMRVLKAGANGYLNKQIASKELLNAVRKILAGGRYVSAALAVRLASEIGKTERPLHENLSDREYAVMRCLVTGRSIKEIASEFSLSPTTVSTYRTRILEKLHMNNDAELVRYALQHGLE